MNGESIGKFVIGTAVVTKAACIGTCLFGPIGGLLFGFVAGRVLSGINLHNSSTCPM